MIGLREPKMLPGEVARELRISVKTVYRLVDEGELAHVRVGRLIRIPEKSVEQYIERQTRERGGER